MAPSYTPLPPQSLSPLSPTPSSFPSLPLSPLLLEKDGGLDFAVGMMGVLSTMAPTQGELGGETLRIRVLTLPSANDNLRRCFDNLDGLFGNLDGPSVNLGGVRGAGGVDELRIPAPPLPWASSFPPASAAPSPPAPASSSEGDA